MPSDPDKTEVKTDSMYIKIKAYIHALYDVHADLPLQKSKDTHFLTTLIALMSFLAILSFSGFMGLNTLTNIWSSGLENKLTIEISVETKNGHILSQETILKETRNLYEMLSQHSSIHAVDVMEHKEIQNLISPWMGDDVNFLNIPLPGLISIEVKDATQQSLTKLRDDIAKVSKYAHLEDHNSWLADLTKFISILKNLSLIIALIICTILVISITSAMRTRLALYNKEIELLHYMGATDGYIIKQFQAHAIQISLKGGCIGSMAGIIVTLTMTFLSRYSGTNLIPVINVGLWGIVGLCIVPFIITLIAVLTSRITVWRTLEKMP